MICGIVESFLRTRYGLLFDFIILKEIKTENIVCFECGEENNIIEDTSKGCFLCNECGAFIRGLIDLTSESKNYGDGEGKNTDRCGAPSNPYFSKSSLGTVISGGNAQMRRIHNWGTMVYKDRTFKKDIEFITECCDKHGIKKNISDTAIFLWKKVSECKHKSGENKDKTIIVRGDNRIGIMAACLIHACIINVAPRRSKEIAKIFKIDQKYVSDGVKQYHILMTEHITFCVNMPCDYINHQADKLKIDKTVKEIIILVSKNIKRISVVNEHTASSIAAGCILLVINMNNIKISRKQLSESFGISEVTISKIYKKIYPYKQLLLNTDACKFVESQLKLKCD